MGDLEVLADAHVQAELQAARFNLQKFTDTILVFSVWDGKSEYVSFNASFISQGMFMGGHYHGIIDVFTLSSAEFVKRFGKENLPHDGGWIMFSKDLKEVE